MKLNKKMSLGITLVSMILLLTISLVNAQPVFIGSSVQVNPWDSRPTVATRQGINEIDYAYSWASAYDGRLTTQVTETTYFIPGFPLGDNPSYTSGFVEFSSFRQPLAAGQFLPIGWVDIKMKYKVVSNLIDDTYSIEYAVGSSAWQVLQPSTKNRFDFADVTAEQVRSWAEIDEPNNHVWDSWPEVSSLKVRISFTDTSANGWDMITMNLFEVWASVWKTPLPPSASTAISVQPSPASGGVTVGTTPAGKVLFVEVFVQAVDRLAGYGIRIDFNTTVLSPAGTAQGPNWWSYYPFTDIAPSEFSDLGYASLAASIHINDPLYPTGVSGNFALARIYFVVDAGRTTKDYSWLTFSVSKIGDPPGNKLTHTEYHGLYGTPPSDKYILKTSSALDPATPISTIWHEENPVYSREYHQTSFTDQGIPGLNPSDQIDLTNATGTYWFHVDQLWSSDLGYDKYIYILATYKPGPIPEFPLGTGIVFLLAPVIPIVYLWRLRKRKVR